MCFAQGLVLQVMQKMYVSHVPDSQAWETWATCIQSLLLKNVIERVENVKSLGFYSRLFSSNQASPKVEASHRPKQAQHFSTRRKVQNGNSRVIRTSLIPGEWVSSIDLSDAYLHIPIHPNSGKYLRFCHRFQVFQFNSLPFRLHSPPGLYNHCKGGEANGPLQGTSPLPG